MLRLADAGSPPPAFGVEMLDRAAAAAALEARELRLLARAVGDHLPIELAIEVAELRARRAALGGA
jgi:hypothetical protein